MDRTRIGLWGARIVSTAAIITAIVSTVHAAPLPRFGAQTFASGASAAVTLAIVQAVEGIALPPASGQSFAYDWSPELGTFVASEQLGPTVLRSPQTIGANRFSLRVGASYFDLNEMFSPISYGIDVQSNHDGIPSPLFAQIGMSAKANVSLLNFAGTYGITDRIEVTLNVPVSIVQVQAYQTYSTQNASLPPSQQQLGVLYLGTPPPPAGQIDQAFQSAYAQGQLAKKSSSFSSLGTDFNNGTHTGVGRISVGGRWMAYDNDRLSVAFAPEFFCNSPNQTQFAGSNSPAILPRVIGQWKAARFLRFHTDVGYDYDFDVSQLRRFVWNSGISVPLPNITFDTGVGGSKFDTAVQWAPTRTSGIGPPEPDFPNGIPLTLTAVNPSATELGTNYVDFLFGVKVRLSSIVTAQAVSLLENTVLSGAVDVPVVSGGFRPAAIGTVALEQYF